MPRRNTGTVNRTLQQTLRSQNRLSAAVGSSSLSSSESSSKAASYPMSSTTCRIVLGPTTSGSNVTYARHRQQVAGLRKTHITLEQKHRMQRMMSIPDNLSSGRP